MTRLVLLQACAAGLAAALYLSVPPPANAQDEAPASRGENFSAKPAPQLFSSDCTGAACHKGPQGLAKGRSQGSLAGFLREHYTNSRESAAALAGYLLTIPSPPAPSETRAPQPGARSSRALARSDEDNRAAPPARGRRSAEPGEAAPKPGARAQRGRQTKLAPPPEPPPPPPPKQFDIFD
jgi:hypothetical protein